MKRKEEDEGKKERDGGGGKKKLFANFGQFTLFRRCPVSATTTSGGEHHISNDFDDQLSRSPRLTLSGEMGTETFFLFRRLLLLLLLLFQCGPYVPKVPRRYIGIRT